jgi:hypothetical protein
MMHESCNKQKQRSAVETSTAWQWLDKYIPRAMNMLTMTDELLEAVSMWPVPNDTEPRKTVLAKASNNLPD